MPHGFGPGVLICHGTSTNGYSSEYVKPLTQAGFAVPTPSRPGYGRTPLDTSRSAEEAAKTIVSSLDNLQGQTSLEYVTG